MLEHAPTEDLPARTSIENGIVVIRYTGQQTPMNARKLRLEAEHTITKLRRTGKPVAFLLDISELKLSRSTSESRLEFKKMAQLDFDRAAVVAGRSMFQIVNYIIHSTGRSHRVRFFTDQARAKQWLYRNGRVKARRSKIDVLIGSLVVISGLSVLAGYAINNHYLKGYIGGLRPMSLLSACIVIIIGVGYTRLQAKGSKVAKISGGMTLLLGGIALFHNIVLGLHSKLLATQPSDIAAVSFVLLGIVLLTSAYRVHWRKRFSVAASFIVMLLSLATIFASLYAHAALYRLSPSFIMSLNLAVTLLVLAIATIVIQTPTDNAMTMRRMTRLGWLVVLSVVLLQVVTYSLWNENINRNAATGQRAFNDQNATITRSLNSRVQAYIEALYGFKGLYFASSYVSQGEFKAYNNSLNLLNDYPGLHAISFVSRVPTSNLSSFIAMRKADTSLNPGGNPNFAIITPDAGAPIHYILTYVANTTLPTPLGTDFTANPIRLKAYSTAYTTGKPVASGKVIFSPGTATQQVGFFITMPVAAELQPEVTIGFVNAVFYYSQLFQSSFTSGDLNGLNISIRDHSDHELLFSSTKLSAKSQPTTFSKLSSIPLLNDSWDVTVQAPVNYGVSSEQLSLPKTVLIYGELVSVLLLIIFFILNNSRREAMRLAEAITEDLDKERQSLLTLARKDEAILEGVGEGLIAFNKDGEVERMNRVAQKLLGYTEEEVIGEHFTKILIATDVEGKQIPLEKRPLEYALKTGKTATGDKFHYLRKDNTSFPVQFTIAAVVLHDQLIGAIEIFRDMTKEQALDKAKDEFVSLASHQLRTPLTASRLFLEMLLDGQVGKLNPQQTDYVSKVDDSTKRMIQLVGDFLNSSRADLGRLKVEPQLTDLSTLVATQVDEQQPVADLKGVTLRFVSKKLPQVMLDQNLYSQVIHNLLTNALRYTPKGGSVTLTVALTDKGYQLDVSDNGIGIPKAAQAKLFGRFFRAENAIKVEGEGSGLGLYLVKRIITLTGGTISYESIEGKGTTFHVIIPKSGMKAKAGDVGITKA